MSVKLIPISKAYREGWERTFLRGKVEDQPQEVEGATSAIWEPYGATGCLSYPGWCVPVDMRRSI